MNVSVVYNCQDNKPVNFIANEEVRNVLADLNNIFPRNIINYKGRRHNRSELLRGCIFLVNSLQKDLPFEGYDDIENYTNDLIELIKLGQEVKEARPKV